MVQTAAPAALPDANADNWVDRRAPERLRPWLKLGRLDRPAGAWLLLLPAFEGIGLAGAAHGHGPDWSLYARMALGAVAMRAAGCAYNDIVDRDIDAKVARTAARPLPSGQISTTGAWAFLGFCSLLGLGVLVTMNLAAGTLGVVSLGLVAAYPFMKRVTWWPQAWLGLTFNWGALLGYAAATTGASALMVVYGKVMVASGRWLSFVYTPGEPPSAPAILLYASGVFWTLGYDTIYAVQDLEDDALAGVKSSARRLGDRAPAGVLLFYVVSCGLALAAGLSARLGPLYYLGLAAFSFHLLRQSRRLKVSDARRALELFRSNTVAGLILALALALGGVRWPTH